MQLATEGRRTALMSLSKYIYWNEVLERSTDWKVESTFEVLNNQEEKIFIKQTCVLSLVLLYLSTRQLYSTGLKIRLAVLNLKKRLALGEVKQVR